MGLILHACDSVDSPPNIHGEPAADGALADAEVMHGRWSARFRSIVSAWATVSRRGRGAGSVSAIGALTAAPVLSGAIVASRNSIIDERATKCFPPTFWTCPMARISDCARALL